MRRLTFTALNAYLPKTSPRMTLFFKMPDDCGSEGTSDRFFARTAVQYGSSKHDETPSSVIVAGPVFALADPSLAWCTLTVDCTPLNPVNT